LEAELAGLVADQDPRRVGLVADTVERLIQAEFRNIAQSTPPNRCTRAQSKTSTAAGAEAGEAAAQEAVEAAGLEMGAEKAETVECRRCLRLKNQRIEKEFQ
jgi:hypothetical protein